MLYNPVKSIQFYTNIYPENIIINVGRLAPDKKYLLKAFSKLNRNDWKLVILGDGSLRKDLEQLADSLNIKNQIYMTGAVSTVDEWLARASIFAFPSISERFPNALLEAMAAELPCISFDCDAGPRDIITNGKNGFLVKLYDIESFSDKLEQLTDNIDQRKKIGSLAKLYANRFNINNISVKFLDFITNNSECK